MELTSKEKTQQADHTATAVHTHVGCCISSADGSALSAWCRVTGARTAAEQEAENERVAWDDAASRLVSQQHADLVCILCKHVIHQFAYPGGNKYWYHSKNRDLVCPDGKGLATPPTPERTASAQVKLPALDERCVGLERTLDPLTCRESQLRTALRQHQLAIDVLSDNTSTPERMYAAISEALAILTPKEIK